MEPPTAHSLAFDMGVRLWRLETALAARKLLSLGRTYEVHYSLPLEPMSLQLSSLGLSVSALMNSHLFQVASSSSSQFPLEFKDKVAGKSSAGEGPICTVEADDYLVGMDVEDFLVCPRNLKQLHKDVAAMGLEVAIKQEQDKAPRKKLVLRFVRLEMAAIADPIRGQTPGRILRLLDEMDAHHQLLIKRYDLLIKQDRVAVQRLHSAKKLLMYVKIMTGDARKTLMKDRAFQFANEFRQWFAAITIEEDESDGDVDMSENGVVDMAVDLDAEQPENDSYNSNPADRRPTTSIRRKKKPSFDPSASKHNKRVTFALDTVPEENGERVPEPMGPPAPAPTLSVQVAPGQAQQSEPAAAPKPRSYGVDEGRAYLLALLGPNVDLVSSLQELATAVQSVPLLSMSKEFTLAPGLKVSEFLSSLCLDDMGV